jgi:hypothetical protein
VWTNIAEQPVLEEIILGGYRGEKEVKKLKRDSKQD